MSSIIRVAQNPRRLPIVAFTRAEFNQLISLYSRRVAAGEWRDYAVSLDAQQASFVVFRHTHDKPLFTIAKSYRGRDESRFQLLAGARKLLESESLLEVLAMLDAPVAFLVNGRAGR